MIPSHSRFISRIRLQHGLLRLFLLGITGAYLCGCGNQQTTYGPDHDAYFDSVFKQAENRRDEAATFIDSVYNAFPDPSTKDIYRKYRFLWFIHAEVRKDYITAMRYADSAVMLMQRNLHNQSDSAAYASAFFLKGDVFLAQKDFAEAFKNYYAGRELIRKNVDSCLSAEFTNRLAIVAYRQQDYANAILHYKQTLVEYSTCTDQNSLGNQQRNINNIGLCFDKLHEPDSALYYFDWGIRLIQNNADRFPGQNYVETMLGVIYGNKADILYQKGQVQAAEELYKESIRLNLKKNHENRDAQLTEMKLAGLYMDTHRFAEAKKLLQDVRLSLDTLPHEVAESRWWPLQQRYYEQTHQTEEAYRVLKTFQTLRDSLNRSQQLSLFNINHEFGQLHQEYEFNMLKKESELKTIYLAIAIVFLCMATVMLAMVWFNRRRRLQLHQNMLEAKNKAEEAALVKQQFLSNMSHEIRTPMNAVVGMTHLLLEDNPKPEQKENLQALKVSSENLLTLLNDILDYNRIDANKMPLDSTDFSLLNLVNDCKRVHGPAAAKKQIECMLDLDPALPDMLIGDPVRLGQILNNLLSNAIKFTLKGSVKFSVRLINSENGKAEIRFTVSDTGIGIDPVEHQTIFDSFTQASAGTAREFGGTGLGLAITRKLIELMGSTIELQSKKGMGASFTFKLTFPLSAFREPPDKMSPQADPGQVQQLANYKVLVVDDNLMNILVVERILKRWDLTIYKAASGTEALELLTQHKVDLILMDLHMPGMNGYEVVAQIREQAQYGHQHTPIIAMTADILTETQTRVRSGGMNDYLSKPFDPNVLYEKLVLYLL